MLMNKTSGKLSGKKLNRSFYTRSTLTVAPELLGKTIVFHHKKGIIAGDIVEVEAYIGEGDPACHAAPGPTARNAVMYEKGGFAYIYFIYGMYYCFNIVTEKKGFPAAVLVRAVQPVFGEDIMRVLTPTNTKKLTNGPGKFCRAFGLTRHQNGLDLTGSDLYIIDRNQNSSQIGTSPRIGIKKGLDKPWRFFDIGSTFLSR